MLISLSDALKEMTRKSHDGKPVSFSIEFWTADRKKKTGGELITIDSCVLSKNKEKEKNNIESIDSPTGEKKQNHWENSTRNLLIQSSGQIRKCHIRLIEKFNGKKVFW